MTVSTSGQRAGGGSDRARRFTGAAATAVRRAGPVGMLVRLLLFTSILAALLLAWPPSVVGGKGLVLLLALTFVASLAPGSPMPAVAIGAAGLGWFLRPGAQDNLTSVWRVVLLAALMYLAHSSAALAAVLPYDAVVGAGVVLPWLRRTGLVLLLTAFVGLVVGVVELNLGGWRYPVLSVAGLVALAALVGYLARLARRR